MACCPTGSQTLRDSRLAAELPNADMEADYGRPKDAMGRVLSNDYDTQRMGRMVSYPKGTLQLSCLLWMAAASVMTPGCMIVSYYGAGSIHVCDW